MKLTLTVLCLITTLALTACSGSPRTTTTPSSATEALTTADITDTVTSTPTTRAETIETTAETRESTTDDPATTAPTTDETLTTPPETTEATTTPTTTPVTTSTALPTTGDYSAYANDDLGWWYRPPVTLGVGEPASIDSGIAALLNKYNAIWRLPAGSKTVYLTMDEGYEFETNSTEILDIAAEKGVPITFFITGSYLRSNPDLVRRMLNEGHQIGNHTQQHLRASTALNTSTETFVNDIRELEQDYQSIIGRPIPKLFRPPEGGYSERSLKITADMGYKTVFWSFAYRDWLTDDQPDQTEAFNKVMGELHDGSILLLHAVSDTNVDILSKLVDAIRAEGYTFALLYP